jgi:hypothetical protein
VESGRITLIKEENVLRDRISVINLNHYRIKHFFQPPLPLHVLTVILNAILLSVIMLSVDTLSVIMFSVVVLSVIMLNGLMLSVVMLPF